MAASQSKSSVHRAQPAHRSVTTLNTATNPKAGRTFVRSVRGQKVFDFPEAKGKVVEGVEFVSSSDFDAISLTFKDKTVLDFVIETCFSVHADYLDRKHGEGRVLKKWPLMHSVRFRSS